MTVVKATGEIAAYGHNAYNCLVPRKRPLPSDSTYDDPSAVAGYVAMRQGGHSANEVIEEPEILSLLPNLSGRQCLDLGCGYGHYSHLLAGLGASVRAIDGSQFMISEAKRRNPHPRVQYEVALIEHANFQAARFDLVLSTLALHYVQDLPSVARRVRSWLAPRGALVISVEHPIYTANRKQVPPPWLSDRGDPAWGVADYFESGLRIGEFGPKYHRTIAEYLQAFLVAGLELDYISEPRPSNQALVSSPDLRPHTIRPLLLVMKWAPK